MTAPFLHRVRNLLADVPLLHGFFALPLLARADVVESYGKWEYAAWLRIYELGKRMGAGETMVVLLDRPDNNDQIKVGISGTPEKPVMHLLHSEMMLREQGPGKSGKSPDVLWGWNTVDGWKIGTYNAGMYPWCLFTEDDKRGIVELGVATTMKRCAGVETSYRHVTAQGV